jgi:basic amino acid/polyamine antiporter, APA family
MPASPAGRQFGLPGASALVVGSVIGTGVFALPSALALAFRALNRRVPGSGGPYLYARGRIR